MKNILFVLLTLTSVLVKGQDDLFLPLGGRYELVSHEFYHLGYADEHEQAAWVAYHLAPSELWGSISRSNDFREDELVISGSSTLSDFAGSGYDRGHLAPAADMAFNELAMSESFFLSNMSPQRPGFNRGVWKRLEMQARRWAKEKGGLFVVTGPVLTAAAIETIGVNLTVPSKYYKVLYSPVEKNGIAFLMDNEGSDVNDLLVFALSIDELEAILGLDLFSQLPDALENSVESNMDFSSWRSTSDSYNFSTSSSGNANVGFTLDAYKEKPPQCLGTAKSTGVRCRKRTSNENGYCEFHQYQVKD